MKTITITKESGRIRMDGGDLDSIFRTMRNGVYTLTLKRKVTKRTLAQNDLMWLWFSCIEDETGTPKEDVHDVYCYKFLRKSVHFGDEMCFASGQTRNLSTDEMSLFLKRVQADAATELGIMLPSPEDRYFEQFYNQYNK